MKRIVFELIQPATVVLILIFRANIPAAVLDGPWVSRSPLS